MKNTFFSLLILSICVLATSCGVMFGGSRYRAVIKVKVHPNAIISVFGKDIGSGKANGIFPRNIPLRVTVKEEGCPEKAQVFNNTFRTGNFLLTMISWGIIGVAIDLGTGASFKPDHLHDMEIKKLTYKTYYFNIDYTGCPVKQ